MEGSKGHPKMEDIMLTQELKDGLQTKCKLEMEKSSTLNGLLKYAISMETTTIKSVKVFNLTVTIS